MGYHNHNVKPDLKKIVDLEDEAEQAEAMALLEEKIRLNQRSEEVDLKLRVKGIDTLTDSYTEELLKEAREHVKLVSTRARLKRLKLKKTIAISATAVFVTAAIALPLIRPQTIFTPLQLNYYYHRNFGYNSYNLNSNKIIEKNLDRTTNEFKRKADTNCDHHLTFQEFVDSYKSVTGKDDMMEKWKLKPSQLEKEIELIAEFRNRNIELYGSNRVYISLGDLSKLSEKIPEPNCTVHIE